MTMQAVQARINLRYLIDNFGIQLLLNLDFFPVGQTTSLAIVNRYYISKAHLRGLINFKLA